MNPYDINELRAALCFAYRLIVASTPLLQSALAYSRPGALRRYYEMHLEEELGHDVMLRADLSALGVTTVPRSFAAAQIAGSQYYLIAHEHPSLLLGYMLALEKESMPVEFVDALSAYHGVSLTALRHHSVHDPEHRKDLLQMMRGLPAYLRGRVLWNESNVSQALALALDEHIARCHRPGDAAVAPAGVLPVSGELPAGDAERDHAALRVNNVVAARSADLASFGHAVAEVEGGAAAVDVVAHCAAREPNLGRGDAAGEQQQQQVSHRPSRGEYLTTRPTI